MPQNLQVNESTVQYLTSLVEKGEYESIDKAADDIIRMADHRAKDLKLAQLLEEADASGYVEWDKAKVLAEIKSEVLSEDS